MQSNRVISVSCYTQDRKVQGAIRYDGLHAPWRSEVILARGIDIVTYWSISRAWWDAIKPGSMDHL